MNNRFLRIYIASSYRHMNAVQMLYLLIQEKVCPRVNFLDWTVKATPPAGLTAAERRAWMDTDHGGEVFTFCRDACASADLVIYYGESGQDVGVEVGIALNSGVEVIGLASPLESPGLMLHGAVDVWARDVQHLLALIYERLNDKAKIEGGVCRVCTMMDCRHDRCHRVY